MCINLEMLSVNWAGASGWQDELCQPERSLRWGGGLGEGVNPVHRLTYRVACLGSCSGRYGTYPVYQHRYSLHILAVRNSRISILRCAAMSSIRMHVLK